MSQFKNTADKIDLYKLIIRTGCILQTLRDSLRQLGLEKAISEVAGSFPEVHERLSHVIILTNEASSDVMNIVDDVQPKQKKLAEEASVLNSRWDATINCPENNHDIGQITIETRIWLDTVQMVTRETRLQLQSIMMAQGMLDISGQILLRMIGVLNEVEKNFVAILRDSIPEREHNKTKNEDEILNEKIQTASQEEVDELLNSLGF